MRYSKRLELFEKLKNEYTGYLTSILWKLTADPNTPHRRKEIVILDAEGKLVQILSKSWPDELLDY